MKKGVHPENYRLVAFKDMSNDDVFITKSTAETKETITVDSTQYYKEPFRPQFHFSPEKKWMNDPNGMLYYKGTYHLFYQYYPADIVWGPMHWGHSDRKSVV